MAALTQSQLDMAQCSEEGCGVVHGPLYLQGACHPQSPTWAVYHKIGELQIECAECGREICAIAVAR